MNPLPDKPHIVPNRELEEKEDIGPSGHDIRCPLCGWSPGQGDLWSCTCGHEWNTFDTGGVCPGYLQQWKEKQCLSCHRLSPHSDWYVQ